jgi:hypothetical protein
MGSSLKPLPAGKRRSVIRNPFNFGGDDGSSCECGGDAPSAPGRAPRVAGGIPRKRSAGRRIGGGHSTVRELIRREPRANWKAHLHFGLRGRHHGLASEHLENVPAAGEVFRLAFIGSNRVGALYRDASAYITPELERRFDNISRTMLEFFIGRYDIRFASLDRLQQGQDFAIIEINGAGAEAIHVWDPNMGLGEVYRTLFAYQKMLFQISAKNRNRGFDPASVIQFFRTVHKQRALIARYPPSS